MKGFYDWCPTNGTQSRLCLVRKWRLRRACISASLKKRSIRLPHSGTSWWRTAHKDRQCSWKHLPMWHIFLHWRLAVWELKVKLRNIANLHTCSIPKVTFRTKKTDNSLYSVFLSLWFGRREDWILTCTILASGLYPTTSCLTASIDETRCCRSAPSTIYSDFR